MPSRADNLLKRLKAWRDEAQWGRGWLADAAPPIVSKLEAELNILAEAGGHGVNLAAMSVDEIRERLFGKETPDE